MKPNLLLTITALTLTLLQGCSKPSEDTVNDLEGDLCFRNEYASDFVEIVRVKANGTGYSVVLHDKLSTNTNIVNGQVRWSYDKKNIIFYSSRGSLTGMPNKFSIGADGSNLVNINNDPTKDQSAFGMSPDGKKLLVNNGSQLYIADSGGGNLKPITNLPNASPYLNIGRAMWCEDSRTILFVSKNDGAIYNIYTIQADGTGLRRITNSDFDITHFSVTRDGQMLAYSHIANSQNNYFARFFTIHADGTGERLVLQSPLAFDPTISPDGKYIAYLGDKTKVTQYDGQDVYIIDADGNNRRRITYSAGSKHDLDWK